MVDSYSVRLADVRGKYTDLTDTLQVDSAMLRDMLRALPRAELYESPVGLYMWRESDNATGLLLPHGPRTANQRAGRR